MHDVNKISAATITEVNRPRHKLIALPGLGRSSYGGSSNLTTARRLRVPTVRRFIVLGSMVFGVKSKDTGTKANGKELHELQLDI